MESHREGHEMIDPMKRAHVKPEHVSRMRAAARRNSGVHPRSLGQAEILHARTLAPVDGDAELHGSLGIGPERPPDPSDE